jgi:hypothetical protein
MRIDSLTLPSAQGFPAPSLVLRLRTAAVAAAILGIWLSNSSARLSAAEPDAAAGKQAPGLRLGRFQVDVTPPLGSPVAYAPARSISDPLSARGIVLLGAGQPIVLCAVDWIGIGGSGQSVWKEQLAAAAGTAPDRVTVHTLHQHDAPRCDFRAEELLAAHGLGGIKFDPVFQRQAIAAVASGVQQAVADSRPVTHLGVGAARVDRVASSRRILGDDGKVAIVRMSSTRNQKHIDAPEGVIDPVLRLVSFWDGDTPLASITYYACHPMSYYGKGDVSADFVGLARAQREKEVPAVLHVHFNGAGGNVAAGKYNNGSPEMRPILTERMADGMRRAWDSMKRTPISSADVEWRTKPVALPVGAHLIREDLKAILADEKKTAPERLNASTKLAWLERNEAAEPVVLSCLRLGRVYLVHMPGELFAEYQLAAQAMRPEDTVCMAAYGDYSPGYIGTKVAYSQGGYETEPRSSNVAPEVEDVLMKGMRELLR